MGAVRPASPSSSFRLQHRNYIDGRWCDSVSGRRFGVHDPADLRELCHEYPLSTLGDVERAVRGAHEAYGQWRWQPLAERVGILRRSAQIIRDRREEIARLITRENGKLLSESLVEVDAAALELDYQIGEGERQFGRIGDCCAGILSRLSWLRQRMGGIPPPHPASSTGVPFICFG